MRKPCHGQHVSKQPFNVTTIHTRCTHRTGTQSGVSPAVLGGAGAAIALVLIAILVVIIIVAIFLQRYVYIIHFRSTLLMDIVLSQDDEESLTECIPSRVLCTPEEA